MGSGGGGGGGGVGLGLREATASSWARKSSARNLSSSHSSSRPSIPLAAHRASPAAARGEREKEGKWERVGGVDEEDGSAGFWAAFNSSPPPLTLVSLIYPSDKPFLVLPPSYYKLFNFFNKILISLIKFIKKFNDI